MASGYQGFSYILGQKVTAIFSMNDEMAFGLYRAARLYGINIPEDISIIGFDNVPFADVMQVPLTTVMINGIVDEGERQQVMYNPKLLVRGSTKVIERK